MTSPAHTRRSLAALLLGLAGLLSSCGPGKPAESTESATVTVPTTGGRERGQSFLSAGTEAAADPSGGDGPGGLAGDAAAGSAGAGATEVEADQGVSARDRKFTSMASYLNPGLSVELLADPGLTAVGAIPRLLTFGQLSLVGVNIDELLDYIYKPYTERAKRFVFPDKVKDLAGEDKAFVGYMKVVTSNRKGEVTSFYLMRDLASCCFGGAPRPDEWVMVEMAEGKTTKKFEYVPVTVRGRFEVGIDRDKDEYAIAVYKMIGDSVELYERPPVQK